MIVAVGCTFPPTHGQTFLLQLRMSVEPSCLNTRHANPMQLVTWLVLPNVVHVILGLQKHMIRLRPSKWIYRYVMIHSTYP